MNLKSILISSVLVASTFSVNLASATPAPMPAPEQTQTSIPAPAPSITPVSITDGIEDLPADLDGDGIVCDPADSSTCVVLADANDSFFFINANAAPPRTTRLQYWACVAKANLVRTACDAAFTTVIGGATYVTGGAAGVATTVAGVGLVQSLQACYALYTAQYNSCRIDRGLPTVKNPL